MKSFSQNLVVLTVALLLLASGVNATLDRLDRGPAENGFVCYDARGDAVFAFTGPQALAQKFPRPVHPTTGAIFHRTDDSIAFAPDVPATPAD